MKIENNYFETRSPGTSCIQTGYKTIDRAQHSRTHALPQLSMAENRPPTRLRAGGAQVQPPDVAWSGVDVREVEEPATVIRRRALQQQTTTSASLTSSASAGDAFSADTIATMADHIDQVEYEFVAKLSIACILVASLAMWFALSFWWDKNVAKSRRVAASRRRRLAAGGHQQQQGPLASEMLRKTSCSESPPADRLLSPSYQGAGASAGNQRDTQGKDVERDECEEDHKTQDREEVFKEFFNPMWGMEREDSPGRGEKVGLASPWKTVEIGMPEQFRSRLAPGDKSSRDKMLR